MNSENMENLENFTIDGSLEGPVQELFAVHENNFCFECGSRANEWASVNNGILLCTACAGIHKGFGLDISFIRSLTTESLTPIQLEMMKKGGNDKLKEFFERYNISMERPFDVKYRTKAAYYYREKLKALAEGQAVPESPSEEEGPEVVDNSSNFVPIGASPKKEKTSPTQNFLAKAKSIKFNVNGPQLKKDMAQGLKSIGNSMAVGAKSVSTGAKNMATKFNTKMKESHFKEDAKVFGNKVAVGAKQTAGKIAVASKKGYVGAVGFFKGLGTKKKAAADAPNDENVNTMNAQENLGEGSPNTVVEDQKPSISL